MGKRCEIVLDGEPCSYLAEDGTCLLSKLELKEKCLALERIHHEQKDEWIGKQRRFGTVSESE